MSVSDPMPPSSPPEPSPIAPPHPLALALAERLRAHPGVRVLDFCTGRGRNATALRSAGFDVVAVADGDADRDDALPGGEPFAAAISTHGLLHGIPERIDARVAAIAARLEPGGLFFATFGSIADARFGRGTRLGPSTFAPDDGDERDVAHTYFTRAQLDRRLRRHFEIERMWEVEADAIAGSWAHARLPLHDAVHWFLVAHNRD